jgi:osmoprotectant transport system permease protein
VTPVGASNGPDSLVWWDYVRRHTGEIGRALLQHVELTAVAVAVGVVASVPLALVARRHGRARTPVLAALGVVYTIPSVALFSMLGPFTGFTTARTVVIALVCYTLLVLVRSIVVGLDGVPEDVREAARGMGYRRWQVLTRVELPLALPSLLAGVRVATVSTVGLVTVAALVGQGGLGELIEDGLRRRFPTPLMVGATLSVALALAADLLLLSVQRLATPWRRR